LGKIGEWWEIFLVNLGKWRNFAPQLKNILTKVEKFGCLQPLEKMLKLRINPSIFTAQLAFFPPLK
jgi:hypothetical protein